MRFVASCLIFVVCFLWFVDSGPPFVVYCLPFFPSFVFACCVLFFVGFLLFRVCCLRFAVRRLSCVMSRLMFVVD